MKYYVDNTVANSTDGTSWSSAWKSFSDINWSLVKPGDTIYVSGGAASQTYTQTLDVGAGGNAGGAVTIKKGVDAGHDGSVIIDGGNTLAHGIILNGRNNVTIDGFSIRNIADAGISVKNVTAGVVVQNNSVYSGDPGGGNARGYDVRNSVGTDAVIVRDNSFSTPANTRAQTDGIWSSGNDGVVFAHNSIVVSNSDTTGHSDGFQSYQDRNIDVRDNWFEQAGMATTDNHGAWISDTQTNGVVKFHNNVVLASNLTNDSAVTHYMEAGWEGTGTADFSNNTIVGGRRGMNIDGSPNVQIRGNILAPASGGSGYVTANGSIPAGNVDNNVVWAPTGHIAYVDNSAQTWAQWQARGYDVHGVAGDPAFKNAAAKDFSLGAASPAAGRGATVPGVATSASAAPTPGTVVPQGAPLADPAPTTSDILDLHVSEDAWQGDAAFNVMIDGAKIGGVYNATASHAAGITQDISIPGNWGGGPHSIGIAFINDAWGGTVATDRNLYVDQVAYDGVTASGAPKELMSNGTSEFTVPAASEGATTTLTFHLAEDAWQGDAQYSIAVDGNPLSQSDAVTASNALGQSQAVDFQLTLLAGNHDVGISFLNDSFGDTQTTDRNLYVKGVDLNGTPIAGTTAALMSTETAHFQFLVPAS